MKTRLTIFFILTFSFILDSFAGSATWKANPSSGEWNNALNWRPRTIPNGADDVATFVASNVTNIALAIDPLEVDSVVFAPGASAFTITASSSGGPLTFSGLGVVNNSGIAQNFVTYRTYNAGFYFNNQATAGSQTVFTTAEGPSWISFNNQATAGSGTFIILGTRVFEDGHSHLYFYDDTSAANASVTNTGGSGFDGAGFTKR